MGRVTVPDPVAAARLVADETLFPDAADVDRADAVPEAHLAALDDAGLTGHAATDAGLAERIAVTAALAGGCLSTAFVWLQHQGALAAVHRAEGPAAAFAPALAAGRLRAGLAITALRGPDPLRIRRDAGGFRISGRVPWVTGWGLVDVLRVAALDEEDRVVSVLVDALPSGVLQAEPLPLVAARAAQTHSLDLDGLPVPDDRLLGSTAQADWWAADAAGLAGNGALPLGVAGRAAALAESEALTDAVLDAGEHLVTADVERLPQVRAEVALLAVRAATVLTFTSGAGAVLVPGHAERLQREAQFLTVFGSRPAIRGAMLAALDV